MSIDFQNSETAKNLMRAFAGESQARNRYTFSASVAKKEGLAVVEAVFLFTANQEKEHAEIFYGFLKEMAGANLSVDGSYPVDQYDQTLDLLKAASHNEFEEHDVVYKAFGDKALEEGFTRIGKTFHMIGEVERYHGQRFQKLADMLEQGTLFVSKQETGWMCLNCGHIYNGKEVPDKCPVCNHDKGYFVRLTLEPGILQA